MRKVNKGNGRRERGSRVRNDIPLLLEDKKSGLNGIYLPMQFTDWLLVEAALLLIGLTKISQAKSGFDHPSVIESPLRLRVQRWYDMNGRSQMQGVKTRFFRKR
jgi:hypothetical protein